MVRQSSFTGPKIYIVFYVWWEISCVNWTKTFFKSHGLGTDVLNMAWNKLFVTSIHHLLIFVSQVKARRYVRTRMLTARCGPIVEAVRVIQPTWTNSARNPVNSAKVKVIYNVILVGVLVVLNLQYVYKNMHVNLEFYLNHLVNKRLC